ncbi:MAG: indolepyruvate ferredoxin oxidoreductase [Deltaproteobacteria bacterium]|nr:indolepyruvate ferredoxin oxidoreductase [Deltaproteobacteria bacterium]
MVRRELLLGDEAVALAAIHAGISGAYGYPGTPSTELFEYIENVREQHGIYARWSANEKVAYEEALGMSFAGRRAIVSMKHVGLNVAADPFVNSGVTGVNGGLVICVADDPGMHSSQDEQDSRHYAKFALIPCLEPHDQQEAYDMTLAAFDLSEEVGLPVMVRIVTRLAHSRSDVVAGTPRPQNPLRAPLDPIQFTLLPSNARMLYSRLTDKQPALLEGSEVSHFNLLSLDGDRSRGIVTHGIAWNYVREAFGGAVPHPCVQIGRYPIPTAKLMRLVEAVPEIVVVEEGYPLIEEALRGVAGIPGKRILGKLDGTFPRTGELNPTNVAAGLGFPRPQLMSPALERVPGRPPTLCPGCGHTDAFAVIKEAMAPYGGHRLFSDIGCYTLGFYPPHGAIQSCVCMGASISMAAGAAHAGQWPVICAIGDSTFAHSGMTPLLTAARRNTDINVFILDNGTVAMTGTQETLATGEELDAIVRGLGVPPEHVRVFTPLAGRREENVRIIREEIEYKGTSVLIARRPCVQAKRRGVA